MYAERCVFGCVIDTAACQVKSDGKFDGKCINCGEIIILEQLQGVAKGPRCTSIRECSDGNHDWQGVRHADSKERHFPHYCTRCPATEYFPYGIREESDQSRKCKCGCNAWEFTGLELHSNPARYRMRSKCCGAQKDFLCDVSKHNDRLFPPYTTYCGFHNCAVSYCPRDCHITNTVLRQLTRRLHISGVTCDNCESTNMRAFHCMYVTTQSKDVTPTSSPLTPSACNDYIMCPIDGCKCTTNCGQGGSPIIYYAVVMQRGMKITFRETSQGRIRYDVCSHGPCAKFYNCDDTTFTAAIMPLAMHELSQETMRELSKLRAGL